MFPFFFSSSWKFIFLITKHFASQFVLMTFVSFPFRGFGRPPCRVPVHYRFNSSWILLYNIQNGVHFVCCVIINLRYCIQGKFLPRFIFALFALWPEGEFKTGLIELYIKDYIRKLDSGRIQDWANKFQNSIGENKTGRIQSCIQ